MEENKLNMQELQKKLDELKAEIHFENRKFQELKDKYNIKVETQSSIDLFYSDEEL